jgi:hypothetical protein
MTRIELIRIERIRTRIYLIRPSAPAPSRRARKPEEQLQVEKMDVGGGRGGGQEEEEEEEEEEEAALEKEEEAIERC